MRVRTSVRTPGTRDGDVGRRGEAVRDGAEQRPAGLLRELADEDADADCMQSGRRRGYLDGARPVFWSMETRKETTAVGRRRTWSTTSRSGAESSSWTSAMGVAEDVAETCVRPWRRTADEAQLAEAWRHRRPGRAGRHDRLPDLM